jgi:hypothetical protein
VPQAPNPQPKEHSGQKGTFTTQLNNDIPNKTVYTEATPAQLERKKRSLQTAAILGNDEDAPPAKRGRKAKNAAATADNLLIDELVPSVPALKPVRPARAAKKAVKAANNIPKQQRRTKEQVAADNEAKYHAATELIRKAEAAKAFLAQMDVDEEQADARMEKADPRRLSGVKHKRERSHIEESEGESFDMVISGPEEQESEIEITVGEWISKTKYYFTHQYF